VGEIDTALVTKALEPIWAAKPETASRVRGRIECLLDWARARGLRSGENPARWRGHLDHLLPSKSKVRRVIHQPAMPYRELPAYFAELRKHSGVAARALEFTILTAARTGEVVLAKAYEIDPAEKVWKVPADRMKGGRAHEVPLSPEALTVIRNPPAAANWLFPSGGNSGAPVSDRAMLSFLQGTHPDLTVHGFRSTFRDWAGDRTNYPRDLIEFALAHKLKDDTEAAYRRSSALEKRRRLMSDWAAYCNSIYQQMAEGTFPKPVKIADGAVAWPASKIAQWQKARIQASEKPAPATPRRKRNR
jgi:integrase